MPRPEAHMKHREAVCKPSPVKKGACCFGLRGGVLIFFCSHLSVWRSLAMKRSLEIPITHLRGGLLKKLPRLALHEVQEFAGQGQAFYDIACAHLVKVPRCKIRVPETFFVIKKVGVNNHEEVWLALLELVDRYKALDVHCGDALWCDLRVLSLHTHMDLTFVGAPDLAHAEVLRLFGFLDPRLALLEGGQI